MNILQSNCEKKCLCIKDAADINHFNCIDYFLENGRNIDELDDWNNSSLVQASCYPLNKNTMRYLLERGASPHTEYKSNDLHPLNLVLYSANSELAIKLLLDYGANPNRCDNSNRSALMRSVEMSSLYSHDGFDTYPYILLNYEYKNPEYIPNINHQDNNGYTALMYGFVFEYYTDNRRLFIEIDLNQIDSNLIALLIEKGADINLKNNDDKTAYDISKDARIFLAPYYQKQILPYIQIGFIKDLAQIIAEYIY